MIIVTNRLHVSAEYAAEFEERFRQRSGLIDTMPGFIRNMVLRPTSEGGPYVVLTMWESQEHFDAWTQSEAFKKAHTGGSSPHVYTAPNHVETFEVLTDTVSAKA
jgi:heme-degrading monooxygenase HmoA